MREKIFWIALVLITIARLITNVSEFNENDQVRISSKVTSEPLQYSYKQAVSVLGLRVYLPIYPEIHYGDYIVVEGTVIDGELIDPRLIEHSISQNPLYKTRNKLVDFYNKNLPGDHAALVSGMVLGSKAGLSKGFWEALKETGTAHVVVASGMNVSFVASFLITFLVLFMARRKAVVTALAGIWVYAILSGFDAPIIRAAVMGSIAFSALWLGRLYSAGRALILSALIMLIIKPEWGSDLGFILSFVATGSLMLFERKVDSLIRFVPNIIRQGLSTSLAAQIGVAPILYYYFGQFNLLSPIINALVLWAVPIITIIGGIAGIVGLVMPFLGRLILLVSYPLTSWFIFVVNYF